MDDCSSSETACLLNRLHAYGSYLWQDSSPGNEDGAHLLDGGRDAHRNALTAALRIARMENECANGIQRMLEEKYAANGQKAMLVTAAVATGIDWLADRILDTVKNVQGQDEYEVYLALRKCMYDVSDDHYRTVRGTATKKDIEIGLRRLCLDARDTGKMHEIEMVQCMLGAIDESNIHMFMNSRMAFMIECVSSEAKECMRRYFEERPRLDAVEMAVRGYHRSILECVSADSILGMLCKILEEDQENKACVIPAIDLLLDRTNEAEHREIQRRLDSKYWRFVTKVRKYDIDSIRMMLVSDREYVHSDAVVKWMAETKRRWLLRMTLQNTRIDAVQEDTAACLLDYSINVLERLARNGAEIRMRSVDVENIPGWRYLTGSLMAGIRITRTSVRTVEKLVKKKMWVLVETIEKEMHSEETERYIEWTYKGKRQEYVNDLCGRGKLDKVKEEWNNTRPGVSGANLACRNGQMDVIKYLDEKGIVPEENGVFWACWDGQTDVVKYLIEKKDIRPDTWGANEACRNGHTDVVRYLMSKGIMPGIWGRNYACENGHTDVVRCLVEEKNMVPDAYDVIWPCIMGHIDLVRYLVDEENVVPDKHVVNSAFGNGHIDLFRYLLERDVESDGDKVDLESINGHTDLIRYLVEKNIIASSIANANGACEGGHIEVVKYLIEERNILPDTQGANEACEGGHTDMVKYLVGKGIMPDTQGANAACEDGHIEVVKYLIEERNILPDTQGANKACLYEHTYLVKYLVGRGVMPDTCGANYVCEEGGYVDILKYLAGKDILPDKEGAKYACRNGHMGILKYLIEEKDILPDKEGANYACRNGHMYILKYLVEERNILPDKESINYACMNGHMDIIKYLIEEKGIMPDEEGINWACSCGQIDMVKYIVEEKNILPDEEGANCACENGYMGILKYLIEEKGIMPDEEGANYACKNGQIDIVKYLVEEKNIMPDSDGADEACVQGHMDVLEYLSSKGIHTKEVQPCTEGVGRPIRLA